MTLCIVTKAQCNCQPDEGVFCPDYKPDWYAQCLMDAITELRAASLCGPNREAPRILDEREVIALAKRAGLPKFMYDTDSSTFALARFAQLAASPSATYRDGEKT